MTKIPSNLIETIKEANRVLIIAHVQPDGDTLGSCFALQNALTRRGKEAHIACESEMPARYAPLFPADELKQPESISGRYDLAVALDCAEKSRLGALQDAFEAADTRVNIDHHITNGQFADFNLVQQASSVGEIMCGMMKQLDVPQNEASAKYLYIAIATDTGNFTYANTSGDTMKAAATLIGHFDLAQTAQALFRRRTLGATRLIGRALQSLQTAADGRIAAVTLTRKDFGQLGATAAESEDVVNYAREIDTTQVAVMFREQKGGVKVSLRSKGDIDVSAIASSFGGGGHVNAAGCFIADSLKQAKKRMIAHLEEIL